MNEWLSEHWWAGWLVVGATVVIAFIRFGATWLRAFWEHGDTHAATLIAAHQQDLREQRELIRELREHVAKAEQHYRECERRNLELIGQVSMLEMKLHSLAQKVGDISGEHRQ